MNWQHEETLVLLRFAIKYKALLEKGDKSQYLHLLREKVRENMEVFNRSARDIDNRLKYLK